MMFDSCRDKKKFIFEVCGIFGSVLSVEEMDYWSVYNLIYYCKFNSLDIQGATFEDLMLIVDSHEKERKRKINDSREKAKRFNK